MIECPFCGEDGFDLVGLKSHLTGEGLIFSEGCQAFRDISTKGQEIKEEKEGQERGCKEEPSLIIIKPWGNKEVVRECVVELEPKPDDWKGYLYKPEVCPELRKEVAAQIFEEIEELEIFGPKEWEEHGEEYEELKRRWGMRCGSPAPPSGK